LDWSADQAALEARPLVIMHATGSSGPPGTTLRNLADPATEPTPADIERHGRAVLSQAVARVGLRHPTLPVFPLLVGEEAAPDLVKLSWAAHLVVVGSRGHGISRAIPTGQVGTWLARRTQCPLVVVPDYPDSVVRQGVLVGVSVRADRAAVMGPVLDFAFRHASLRRLPLTVVTATRDAQGDGDEDRERWAAEAVSGQSDLFPDVSVRSMLVEGRPVRTLLRMADRMDLLVVGQHIGTRLAGSPVGHVRSSIVDRSPCPTAVVPAHVAEPASIAETNR
jgi:nucleotide-binding universal stress UspA family protein